MLGTVFRSAFMIRITGGQEVTGGASATVMRSYWVCSDWRYLLGCASVKQGAATYFVELSVCWEDWGLGLTKACSVDRGLRTNAW